MKLDLNRSVALKMQAYEKAMQALIDVTLQQQRSCKHEVVWEVKWESNGWVGSLPARRMCVACRYEEVGSRWSGGTVWTRDTDNDKGFYLPVLGNALRAPEMSRDGFYAMRLPVKVPDYVLIDFVEAHKAQLAKRPFLKCPNKDRSLDPLEGCSDCGGCGYHRSVENPDFKPPSG